MNDRGLVLLFMEKTLRARCFGRNRRIISCFFRGFFQLTQLPSSYWYKSIVCTQSHPKPTAATDISWLVALFFPFPCASYYSLLLLFRSSTHIHYRYSSELSPHCRQTQEVRLLELYQFLTERLSFPIQVPPTPELRVHVLQRDVSASIYSSLHARRSTHIVTLPREDHPHHRDGPKGNTDDIRQDRNDRTSEARSDPRVFPHVAEDPERVFERRAQ